MYLKRENSLIYKIMSEKYQAKNQIGLFKIKSHHTLPCGMHTKQSNIGRMAIRMLIVQGD